MATSEAVAPPIALLAPRHWPSWALVGALWLAVRLPYRWQLAAGRLLGRLLYRTLIRRRHIARVNLRLCFPHWSQTERQRVLLLHFESLGIAVFEMGLAWWAADSRLRDLATVEGVDYLRAAQARGKGVILLSAHFTTLEVGGRLLAPHLNFCPMYRRSRNPVWDAVVWRGRARHFPTMIDRQDVRGVVKQLRANRAIWYAPDQNYGREHSLFVPFFGVPAATITATSRLARMTGAAVVPFFHHRLPAGRGYSLHLLPPLENFPSGDDAADASRINRLVEQQVLRNPDQYLWIHRRFKTRPDPGENLYQR